VASVDSSYKKEGDCYLIEVHIKQLSQLYNSFDPSPFIEKDLDDDAVDYIVSSVKQFPLSQKLKLLIEMPKFEMKRVSETHIRKSITNYFSYAADNLERRLRNKLKDGRFALFVGVVTLVTALSLADVAQVHLSGFLQKVAVNGMLIGGWAAMWFPISTFLYEWWPLAREIRLNRKIAEMPVDFRFY
jgi:hypothetical protein